MATELKKPVSREIREWCRKGIFGLGGSSNRSLIVTLEPGGIISFRQKGLRKSFDIDVETVFNLSVRKEMAIEKKAKKTKRKGSR